MKNTKKGISLIVLVITIIVMIILATAIILSLNNSGIIEKANKAKTDSDMSNLKEYANVLETEWELMTESEKTNAGVGSSTEYVNKKFEEKGYTDFTYSAEGEVYSGLNDIAKEAISKGLKIKDRVNYTVTSKTEAVEFRYSGKSLSNKTDFTWRYIGTSDKGELLIAPDMEKGENSSQDIPKVEIGGGGAYFDAPGELDRVCGVLYTVTGKGKARSMNIDDVNRILGYTPKEAETFNEIAERIDYNWSNFQDASIPINFGELKDDCYTISKNGDISKIANKDRLDLVFQNNAYWLASACVKVYFDSDDATFFMRYVNSYDVNTEYTFTTGIYEGGADYCVRPIVTLTSKIVKGTDAKGEIWQFE